MAYDPNLSAALVPPPPRPGWGPVDPGAKIIAGIGSGFTLCAALLTFSAIMSGAILKPGEEQIAFALMILAFGGIGGLLALIGWAKILHRRRTWKHGEATQATVTEVGIDRTVKVNGRRPPQITYTYTFDGKEHTAQASGFHAAYATLQPSQKITVLVDRAVPSVSVPWIELG